MMFINTFVHVLEVATALLVLLTAFQVHRCYRDFYQAAQVPNVVTPVVAPLPRQVAEKPFSASDTILNDYIGEFFMETNHETVANIDAYKIDAIDAPKLTAAIIPDKKENSNVLSFDERSDVVADNCSFENSLENEDDSVITVMPSSKTSSGEIDESIMSDKVVHAMLDEAKLVCVS